MPFVPFCGNESPRLTNADIDSEAAVLVSHSAQRNPWSGLVLEFDDFVLCGRRVGCKRYKQVARNALLNGDTRAGVLRIAAQDGIDGKLRNAGDLLEAARYLTAHA